MPTALLVAALAAATAAPLELTVDAPSALPTGNGSRALLVVTVRNAGNQRIVFLPRALSVAFSGAGARLQPYDEGPPLPPLDFESRVVAPGQSTRVEILATWTDANAWQLPAGGGRRANWFLRAPGKYEARVTYAVRDAPLEGEARLPDGLLWTGELVAAPIALDVTAPAR